MLSSYTWCHPYTWYWQPCMSWGRDSSCLSAGALWTSEPTLHFLNIYEKPSPETTSTDTPAILGCPHWKPHPQTTLPSWDTLNVNHIHRQPCNTGTPSLDTTSTDTPAAPRHPHWEVHPQTPPPHWDALTEPCSLPQSLAHTSVAGLSAVTCGFVQCLHVSCILPQWCPFR